MSIISIILYLQKYFLKWGFMSIWRKQFSSKKLIYFCFYWDRIFPLKYILNWMLFSYTALQKGSKCMLSCIVNQYLWAIQIPRPRDRIPYLRILIKSCSTSWCIFTPKARDVDRCMRMCFQWSEGLGNYPS